MLTLHCFSTRFQIMLSTWSASSVDRPSFAMLLQQLRDLLAEKAEGPDSPDEEFDQSYINVPGLWKVIPIFISCEHFMLLMVDHRVFTSNLNPSQLPPTSPFLYHTFLKTKVICLSIYMVNKQDNDVFITF